MKIAIVISAYNRLHFLKETLDSCFSQKVPSQTDLFVIVSDDGSKDQTAETLAQQYHLKFYQASVLADSLNRFFVVSGANAERGAARNRGAKFASQELGADWLLFLDSDDKLAPNSIARFCDRISLISDSSDTAALYAKGRVWFGGDVVGPEPASRNHAEGEVLREILQKNFISIGASLVSARAFNEIGGFSENREMSGSEDWHLSCRLALWGQVLFSDHTSYYYRRHSENTAPERFQRSIPLSRRAVIPLLQEKFGARSGALIREMMGYAFFAVSATYNSDRRPRQALFFALQIPSQNFMMAFDVSYYRLILSILWRGLNRSARYLIRLDDACPTMHLKNWNSLESALDALKLRPIVGVIPENKNEILLYAEPEKLFWDRVRAWQAKGWTIAMHGYQHILNPADRSQSLVPLEDFSEFVGLSLDRQRELIRKGYAIFLAEGIRPKVWMAPAHSFDKNTLRALELETDIRVITDGFAWYPFSKLGFTWLPQQLWTFKKKLFGVWTVCFHPSSLQPEEMEKVLNDLVGFQSQIVGDHQELVFRYQNRRKTLADQFVLTLHFMKKRLINVALQLRKSVTHLF